MRILIFLPLIWGIVAVFLWICERWFILGSWKFNSVFAVLGLILTITMFLIVEKVMVVTLIPSLSLCSLVIFMNELDNYGIWKRSVGPLIERIYLGFLFFQLRGRNRPKALVKLMFESDDYDEGFKRADEVIAEGDRVLPTLFSELAPFENPSLEIGRTECLIRVFSKQKKSVLKQLTPHLARSPEAHIAVGAIGGKQALKTLLTEMSKRDWRRREAACSGSHYLVVKSPETKNEILHHAKNLSDRDHVGEVVQAATHLVMTIENPDPKAIALIQHCLGMKFD